MKKLLVALPFVAGAAAIAGTSQYSGTQTESEYHKLLNQLNGLSPLVFVNEQYVSGLVNSSAVTKVSLSEADDAEVLFRLQHDIKHSPVHMAQGEMKLGAASIDTRLYEDASVSPEFLALFADGTPFTLNTDIKFTGEISNQLKVNSVAISENGRNLKWSGIDFDGVTKDGATEGAGAMGPLTYSDNNSGAQFNFGKGKLDVDVQHVSSSVYIGTIDMSIDDVSVLNSKVPMPVSLGSVDFSSSTDMQDGLYSSESRFSLNQIESPLPLDNASMKFDMVLKNEVVKEYAEFMTALAAEADKGMDDSEIDDQLADILVELLGPGSGVNYSIALDNSGGDVKADLSIAVKDDAADAMQADTASDIATVRDILQLISLNGSLNADTAALAQTPIMMMLGGARDFITVTDESITSEVSLRDTTLLVNGVALPLDQMFAGIVDAPLF